MRALSSHPAGCGSVHLTLSGPDVEQMSPSELEAMAPRVAVFYRVTPRHKLAIVQVLGRARAGGEGGYY